MNLESAVKYFSPKGMTPELNSPNTSPDALNGSDIMAAIGIAQSKSWFGVSLFLAKLGIEDKERCVVELARYAVYKAPQPIRKVCGSKLEQCMRILAVYAFIDYSMSAETARCRCNGTGKKLDKAKTKLTGIPVLKTCERCDGRGYAKLPSSVPYKAVLNLLNELSQPSWSRHWKPFYEQLCTQCFKEESISSSIFSKMTR